MPLITSHNKGFDTARVKSHVLPRPSFKTTEKVKRRACDLESYSPSHWSADVFAPSTSPLKIGRFNQLDESDGNTSSDDSLFGHSPRAAYNAPLTLRVAAPRKLVKGSEPLMGCDLPRDRPEHIITCLRMRDTAGSLSRAAAPLSATVDQRCEIKRRDGRSFLAPIYFSQFSGAAAAINVAIKTFPQESVHASGDHRGTAAAQTSSGPARQQFEIAQKLGNAFAPLHLTEISGVTYIDYPLAKASLSDVIRSVYGARSHCARLSEQKLRSLRTWTTWRVMKDLLAELTQLHELGYSHNNLRPSNILVDAAGHFHLAGFGAAAKKGLPENGDWNNKRLEAVFNYGDHNSCKDDLWALGKLFVRLLTQPQKNAEDAIDSLWDATDPFKPNYDYPSPDNVNNLRLPVEVSTLPENKAEAKALHGLWAKLYKDYKGWYDRKNEARKARREFAEPWPALPRFETPELREHAQRIYKVFHRLSRKDLDGSALRFALALFNPDMTHTTTASKLTRQFSHLFDYLFVSEQTSKNFASLQEVAPRAGAEPTAVSSERPALSPEEETRLRRYREVDSLLSSQLGLIEGDGMRLCNQLSASHTIRSPSPKRTRLDLYEF